MAVGRRFVITVLAMAVVTLLRWFDHLDNASFQNVMTWVACGYIGGDTWQRHVEVKTTGRAVGEPPIPPQP